MPGLPTASEGQRRFDAEPPEVGDFELRKVLKDVAERVRSFIAISRRVWSVTTTDAVENQ